jgi:hypothetical protein
MKFTLLLLASAGAVLPAGAVDLAIPAVFPPERYEAMIARSPFALATPPAPVAAAPEKNFADGWYVSGLAQLDGQDFVTIKSRDLAVQFSLFGNEPKDGVTLQRVEWSPSIGRSTVTIVKDGQTAKLEFNQAELQSAASPAAAPSALPPGMVRPPAAMNAKPGMVRPAIPRPAPSVQPVVQPQQYGGSVTNPGNVGNGLSKPGGLSGAPTPDNNRRRIRVINNVPAQ